MQINYGCFSYKLHRKKCGNFYRNANFICSKKSNFYEILTFFQCLNINCDSIWKLLGITTAFVYIYEDFSKISTIYWFSYDIFEIYFFRCPLLKNGADKSWAIQIFFEFLIKKSSVFPKAPYITARNFPFRLIFNRLRSQQVPFRKFEICTCFCYMNI